MIEYEPFVKQAVRILRKHLAQRGEDYVYVRDLRVDSHLGGRSIRVSEFCDLVEAGDPVTTEFLDLAMSAALQMVHLKNVPVEER